MKPKLIAVVGPTASGKTALALRLSREVSGAVISADSRQVYAGMNIGTARPAEAWREAAHDEFTADMVSGIPHFLLNIREPNRLITLAEWQLAAFSIADRLIETGYTPLLVGGTMLYADSVIYNFSIPRVAPQPGLREKLTQRDSADLYAELLSRDPAASRFIEPHHTRRIIRALEVMEVSGKRFSEMRQRSTPRYGIQLIGIFPGWDTLENAIRERTHAMLAEGLVAERQHLIDRYGADLPLWQTVNYKEAPDLEAMVRANMRYARRQMSWWRGRKDIRWFSNPDAVPVPL